MYCCVRLCIKVHWREVYYIFLIGSLCYVKSQREIIDCPHHLASSVSIDSTSVLWHWLWPRHCIIWFTFWGIYRQYRQEWKALYHLVHRQYRQEWKALYHLGDIQTIQAGVEGTVSSGDIQTIQAGVEGTVSSGGYTDNTGRSGRNKVRTFCSM